MENRREEEGLKEMEGESSFFLARSFSLTSVSLSSPLFFPFPVSLFSHSLIDIYIFLFLIYYETEMSM